MGASWNIKAYYQSSNRHIRNKTTTLRYIKLEYKWYVRKDTTCTIK